MHQRRYGSKAQLSLTNRPTPDFEDFAIFAYPLFSDALREMDSLELSGSYLVREN